MEIETLLADTLDNNTLVTLIKEEDMMGAIIYTVKAEKDGKELSKQSFGNRSVATSIYDGLKHYYEASK